MYLLLSCRTALCLLTTLCALVHCPSQAGPESPSKIALATKYEGEGAWLSAAHVWQNMLADNPRDPQAFRHRVLALSRGGAPYLACRLADQRKQLFSEEEQYQLQQAAAALTLSFGMARQGWQTGPQRYDTTEQAMADQDDLLLRFGPRNPTRFDRLLALRSRGRIEQAVALYEDFVAQQIVVPPYARTAAGQAYLSMRRPERARDLLTLVDTVEGKRGESIDAELALSYAYLEAEQPDQAIALIDRLLANEPISLQRGLPGVEQPNPDYTRLAVQAATLRLYANRIEQAEQRLSNLRMQAPFNADVRLAWANLQSARERRRIALDEFNLMLVDHPASIEAQVGAANALLALHRLPQSRARLRALVAIEPDQRDVREFGRQLQLHLQPAVSSELLVGRGAVTAGATSVFDLHAVSAPLGNDEAQDLRMHAHLSRSRGTTSADRASNSPMMQTRERIGAGFRYRDELLALDVELNRAVGAAPANGAAFMLATAWTDSWQLRTSFDSNLNSLSAAAYRAGITARQAQVAIDWSASEARKAGFELTATRFTDGNRREAVRLGWNERWLANSHITLDALASLSLVRNRTQPTPYFNPSEEHEASVGMQTEWLTWRRYQRYLRQRMTLQLGRYQQAGYAADTAADFRYEQSWQLDDALHFAIGAGHGFHPYDGMREHRTYGFINLNWIMQ